MKGIASEFWLDTPVTGTNAVCTNDKRSAECCATENEGCFTCWQQQSFQTKTSECDSHDPQQALSNLTNWSRNISFNVVESKMLELLKRTCPLLTDIKVRQHCIWLSSSHNVVTLVRLVPSLYCSSQKIKSEQVQKPCTNRWICKEKLGDGTYRNRLSNLNLAVTSMLWSGSKRFQVFFYKALHDFYNESRTN